MQIKENIGKISKLAWALVRKGEAASWGDAFRAAVKLLSRKAWQAMRASIASKLTTMARIYSLDGDTGRALAFSRGADVVARSATFAAFTKSAGIGPSLRQEAAALALPYNSRRFAAMVMV